MPAASKKVVKRYQAGRPTAAELERRKKKVLDVATKLFVREGYAGTSLVDIAKGAGVATRTVYQHFGDKPAIFQEVIYARDVGATVAPPEWEEGESLYAALMAAAAYACQVALRDKAVELMRLMVAERNRFPDLMKKVANATFFKFQHNIERMFVDLAQRKLIPDGDHAQSAKFFIDLILGQAPMHIYTGWLAELPTEAELEAKVDLFMLGRFGAKIAKDAREEPRRPARIARQPFKKAVAE